MLGYLTRKEAIKAGFQYEGTLFGVPAWFQTSSCESPAAPKFLPAVAWITLADLAYEAFTYLMHSDQMIEAPIRVTRRIPGLDQEGGAS